eukprot:gene8095-1339_t
MAASAAFAHSKNFEGSSNRGVRAWSVRAKEELAWGLERRLMQTESSEEGPGALTSDSSYPDSSLDDPAQREALLHLYSELAGYQWVEAEAASVWNSSKSYCRWLGVGCCLTSPYTLVRCTGDRSVVFLALSNFGLQGSLPNSFGSDFSSLISLSLDNNPNLVGQLPSSMASMPLLWASVMGSSLKGCVDYRRDEHLPSSSCQLSEALEFSAPVRIGSSSIVCPVPILKSFRAYTQGMSDNLKKVIISPLVMTLVPGYVLSDPVSFSGVYNCSCVADDQTLMISSFGVLSCDNEGGSTPYILIILLVAILPTLLIAFGLYICFRHKDRVHRLIRSKETARRKKMANIPGVPPTGSRQGIEHLATEDDVVTWVVTDIADSTNLWEWDSNCMDKAILLHDQIMRDAIESTNGHEISNEGDAYVISFHDALDGVNFCLKAQKQLCQARWPKDLLKQTPASKVYLEDVVKSDLVSSRDNTRDNKKRLLLAGLRIRMGINTGVPAGVTLKNGCAEYRGEEYDIAKEICDLAAGGQILMGPRTFQRSNKLYVNAAADPLPHLVGHLPAPTN